MMMELDGYELLDDGPVHLRWRREGAYHREARMPGADISDLTPAAQAAILSHWTPERVAAWRDGQDAAEEELARLVPDPPRLPNLEPDQFWFALRVSGYEQDVNDWLASLNDAGGVNYDPITWAEASAKLQYAKFFERDHELILGAASAIGIPDHELDALWVFSAS